MKLADAAVGLRVVYVGPSEKHAGKAGVVDRVVKSEWIIVIRWDEPGPLAYEKTFRANAANVRPA